MSYDLYFYKQKSSNLTEEEFCEYLTNNSQLNNEEHSKQWNYENAETGVYFGIDWNEPETDEYEIEQFDNYSDFDYLNFNFTINFIRPNFFGYEVFPIIEKIIEDLDVYVLNLQDEINTEKPQKFQKGYLQKQWIKQNEDLILSNFETFQSDYFPLEKSDKLWQFQFNRENLQDSLNEDIFVAGYFTIKKLSDNNLYTFCVWPNHIPIIFPPVDFVIIQKEYKKLFRNIKESGMISFEKITQQFGNYFEDFPGNIPNLKVLRQSNSDKIKTEFNALKIEYSTKEFGTIVPFDKFVNVKP